MPFALKPPAGICRSAVLALSVLAGFAPAALAEQVKLGQPAATTLTFGPIFAAMELGYFKQEGIDLEILDFNGSSTLMPLVANKSVTFGFPGPDPLVVSHQKGKSPLPIKFVFNAARQNIWQFVVMDESPIKTLEELKGKKVGVASLGNATVLTSTAMLDEIGLKKGKDYTFMTIGMGPPAFRATVNGEVDTYNTYDTNIAAFEATGAKLRFLEQPKKYRELFSNGFVTHLDTIKEKPQLVAGFGRAVAKGIITCEVNPDFCVDAFYRARPDLKPAGLSDEEVMKRGKMILESRMKSYLAFPPGEPRRFGAYSEEAWKNHISVLYEGGVIQDKDITPADLYTPEFVDAFNDFDVEDIRKKAAALPK